MTAPASSPRGKRRSSTRKPARRRRRNRADTVAAIVAAASDLLARKGPNGFGLVELGAKAGVSFGLIHRYFGGKAGLVKAALREPFARQLSRVLALYEGGDLRHGPAPLVALLFEAQRRNPEYVRLIAWGVLAGLLTPDVFAGHRRAIRRLLTLYRAEVRGSAEVDERAVGALLITATLGFQLFRPLLRALFTVDATFDRAYQRHLEVALESFRDGGPATRRSVTRPRLRVASTRSTR